MNRADVRPILAMVAGYWPQPVLSTEEATAWAAELCGSLRITPEEARTVIVAAAEDGREFRMKPGQLVPAVQALRRQRALERIPMLASAAPAPTDRSRAWIRACMRIARGEPVEAARAAEGVA